VAAFTLPESLLTNRKRDQVRKKYSIVSMACAVDGMVKKAFLSLFFRHVPEFAVSDSFFVRGLARTLPG
jgi:hypothetical protein